MNEIQINGELDAHLSIGKWQMSVEIIKMENINNRGVYYVNL